MKFTCTQENLNKHLSIVSHIASKNTTLPILSNVMFSVSDGALKLTSTNLEIGIHSVVRGSVDAEGTFTVAAKLLSDYVNLLPNEQVSLEVKENTLHIQCQNHKTKINGLSAEDFPLIPAVEAKHQIKIKSGEFKKSLMQVSFAASMDETRPEINGVYFQFLESKLTLVGTDGHRLSEKSFILDGENSIEADFIVPIRTIQEVIRGMGDLAEEDDVEIVIGESQVKFIFSGTEIVSRLVEGNFPDYKQIIPQNFQTTCRVPVGELVNLVKGAALFCRMGMNDISLTIEANTKELIVSSSNSSLGENVAKLSAEVDGMGNSIIFNYRYLLDGLNNIHTDKAELLLVDGQNAGLLKSEGKDNYRYVIMPIKK